MNAQLNEIDNHVWLEVGRLDQLPRRGARRVDLNGVTVAIFRTLDDRLYALEDRCPHRDGPLSQGIVHDDCVTCPLHNWVVRLASGEAQGADQGRVARYPVRLGRDGALLLSAAPVPT